MRCEILKTTLRKWRVGNADLRGLGWFKNGIKTVDEEQ
jgi:hypothetical protein